MSLETTYAEIARECDVDYRTVKKYLAAGVTGDPLPGAACRGTQASVITPDVDPRIVAMLRADMGIQASLIHVPLIVEHGFTGHYQRVRIAVARLRPVIDAELDAGDEVGR